MTGPEASARPPRLGQVPAPAASARTGSAAHVRRCRPQTPGPFAPQQWMINRAKPLRIPHRECEASSRASAISFLARVRLWRGESRGVAEAGVAFQERDAGYFAGVGAGVFEHVQAVADVDG